MSGKVKRIFIIIISSLCILFIGGCAGSIKETRDVPEKDKWGALAETSKGHSPSPSKHEISIAEYKQQIEKDNIETKEKPLPTMKVSLKLRNADIKSILRALARSADLNLLIKDDIKGNTSVDFSAAPWDQVFNSVLNAFALTYTWEGDIIRVMSIDDMEQVLKAETIRDKQKAQKLLGKLAENLSTVVIAIDYADAKALKDNLQDFVTKDKDGKPRGSVRVDEYSNSLIIQATRDDLEKMLPVIDKLDKPTPQILIRANIVETTKNIARDLGIQWGGVFKKQVGDKNIWITPGGSSTATTAASGGTTGGATSNIGKINEPLSAGYSPTGGVGLSGQGLGVNFPVASTVNGVGSLGLMFGTLGGNILDAQLQALQSEGKLNIISSPSITTIDNQKAFAESGERVPYVSTSSTSGGVTQDVKFVDAVLRLEITPHVIDGKSLKMKIIVKKDEVDTSRSVQGNPFIIKKQTETTLIVQHGETVVISGLTRQRKSDIVNGVPGLKDMPLLGWLFKGESRTDDLEEVLIFITPHILPLKTAEANINSDGPLNK